MMYFIDLLINSVFFVLRLYEAHKKLQKVNQSLEDKLLKVVDKFETEKNSLSRDLSSVSRSLAEERAKNSRLLTENVSSHLIKCLLCNIILNYLLVFQERYRNDVNLTIQLLQCKPSNFMPQKFDSVSYHFCLSL